MKRFACEKTSQNMTARLAAIPEDIDLSIEHLVELSTQ